MLEIKKKYLKETNERIEAGEKSLASGGCDNFSEYKERCGYIQALKDAEDLFQEVWEQIVGKEEG